MALIWPWSKPPEGSSPPQPPPQPRRLPSVHARNWVALKVARILADWTTAQADGEALTGDGQLPLARARCRDLSRNNPYGKRFKTLLKTNVVGPQGIRLQSLVQEQLLAPGAAQPKPGQSPIMVADSMANQAIEDAWRRWGEVCSMDGGTEWPDHEHLGIGAMPEDGEYILQKVYGRQAGNPFNFAIHQMDPAGLDESLNVSRGGRVGRYVLPADVVVRQGIEMNLWRRPLAYWFKDASGIVPATAITINPKLVRIEAQQIVHIFVREWTNQIRGVPWAITSVKPLKELDAYIEAAVTNARIGASKMGFFTRKDATVEYGSGTEDENGDIEVDVDPGEWEELPPGVDIATWDPQYPAQEFEPFVKMQLRRIAAGLGPAYTSLAMDLSDTNFAGSRQGLLEERDYYRVLQRWYARALHNKIFNDWLRWALLSRQILHPVSGNPLPADRLEKFEAHSWAYKTWDWVNPAQDAAAARTKIELGVTSESAVQREIGQDPTEVLDERAREKQEKQRRGLRTSTDVLLEQGQAAAAPATTGPQGGQ